MDYRIKFSNVRLVDIGIHDSIPKRTLRYPQIKKSIIAYRDELDVMLIRGPSPLLPNIAQTLGGLPIVLLLVGDITLGIDELSEPQWRRKLIRIWSNWNKDSQTRVAKNCLTLVNSHKLYTEYQPLLPELVEVRTTTLEAADFFERDDTCTSAPYHLLYTGRMNKGKGIFDMVEALAILVNSGMDAMVDLVGWSEQGDLIIDEMFSLAQAHGIHKRILYHGYKAVGPELFAFYKQADIYWIASQSSSEEFPRTIWEAMAHSLPVIATRVGSIPDFIKNDALLVNPFSPSELAIAVTQLVETPALRQKLILSGRKLAHENTLEFQTKLMVAEIESWVARHAKKSAQ